MIDGMSPNRFVVLLGFVVATISSAGGSQLAAQTGSDEADLHFTRQLLAGARGTNPLMCELALQTLDRRFGNWYGADNVPDANWDHGHIMEWTARSITSPEVVPFLTPALSDSDVCVRRVAARLFGRAQHPEALEALVDRLRNGDELAREMAAVALGFLENREAGDALIRSLSDAVPAVRRASAWALGEIEDDRAVDALTDLLEDDPDASVRVQAARALGEIG